MSAWKISCSVPLWGFVVAFILFRVKGMFSLQLPLSYFYFQFLEYSKKITLRNYFLNKMKKVMKKRYKNKFPILFHCSFEFFFLFFIVLYIQLRSFCAPCFIFSILPYLHITYCFFLYKRCMTREKSFHMRIIILKNE